MQIRVDILLFPCMKWRVYTSDKRIFCFLKFLYAFFCAIVLFIAWSVAREKLEMLLGWNNKRFHYITFLFYFTLCFYFLLWACVLFNNTFYCYSCIVKTFFYALPRNILPSMEQNSRTIKNELNFDETINHIL